MNAVHDYDVTPAVVRATVHLIRAQTGVDFAAYSPAMVPRRLRNHMLAIGATDGDSYLSRLQASPSLVRDALAKLTIKVSRFYRNPAVFDRLAGELLPALSRENGEAPLRIWCAGGAGGEEPYTFAMLLAELDISGDVLVTDIDEAAIERARAALFPNERRHELPEHLHHWCEPTPTGGHFRIADEVRARVRFVRHDLTGESALNTSDDGHRTFDLVSCRNVLIYFNRIAQQCAMQHLTSPLRDGGVLLLGEAEWPPSGMTHHLQPIAPTLRLFRAQPDVELLT